MCTAVVAPGGGEVVAAVLALFEGEVVRLEGMGLKGERLEGELSSYSLFEKKRLVIVEEAEGMGADCEGVVTRFAEGGWGDIFLFLIATTSLGKIGKIVEKKGALFDLSEEKSWESEKRLLLTVMRRSKESGIGLATGVAKELVALARGDEGVLWHEFEKLVTFAHPRKTITIQDLSLLCAWGHQETLWQCADALFESDAPQAYRSALALFEEGVSLFALLAYLRGQLRILFEIEGPYVQGGIQATLTALPHLRKSLVEKRAPALKRWGREGMEEALVTLLEIELLAKNSSLSHLFLIEMLLFKILRPKDASLLTA